MDIMGEQGNNKFYSKMNIDSQQMSVASEVSSAGQEPEQAQGPKKEELKIENKEVKITDSIKVEAKEVAPVEEVAIVKQTVDNTIKLAPNSKYLSKWFNKRTGQMHWDICQSNATGRKFVAAFEEFGADKQVIACVTLNYENGIVGGNYITDAVSPCWSTNAAQAQARKCTYASDNADGVDAGLFMISTYWQSKNGNIAKLGGPTCKTFQDSKDPKDPCNAQLIPWLHDIDNQIKIVKHIYKNQGFTPWVAYNKHVKPFI